MEENEEKDPVKPTEGDSAEGAEGTEPKEPETGNEAEEQPSDEDIKDQHGQVGISRAKYEREMEAKDARIAELEAKVEENAKTAAGRDELKKEIEALKAANAETKTNFELELAGCRNVKAAKALLEDYEGNIAKLKEAEPWLFQAEKQGSTGLKPEGAPDAAEQRRKIAEEAASGKRWK